MPETLKYKKIIQYVKPFLYNIWQQYLRTNYYSPGSVTLSGTKGAVMRHQGVSCYIRLFHTRPLAGAKSRADYNIEMRFMFGPWPGPLPPNQSGSQSVRRLAARLNFSDQLEINNTDLIVNCTTQ